MHLANVLTMQKSIKFVVHKSARYELFKSTI